MPEFSQWDYQGSFLSLFPQNTQSTIANLFCNAVRGGAKTIPDIIQAVEWDLIRRQQEGYEGCLATIMDQLHDAVIDPAGDAPNFAAFILWREGLTPEAKARLKADKGRPYAEQKMSGEAATPAQLRYLQGLGVTDVPDSKLQASQWIDKITGGQK